MDGGKEERMEKEGRNQGNKNMRVEGKQEGKKN
jgi:hypothetical protein